MNTNIPQITFLIANLNSSDYTDMAIKYIRQNCVRKDHKIIIFDDNSDRVYQNESDDSLSTEWMKLVSIQKKYDDVELYQNKKAESVGCPIAFDVLHSKATTDWSMFLHSDMVVCPDFDRLMFEHVGDDKNIVFCPTRFEPPVEPNTQLERIQSSFGLSFDDFNEKSFNALSKIWAETRKDEIADSIWAPILIHKDMYSKVNGQDHSFRPVYFEDDDFYHRLKLAGAKFIQAWNTTVYHFVSKSSKFQEVKKGEYNKAATQEYGNRFQKSERNYMRKWGVYATRARRDNKMVPILHPKYNIRLILDVQDVFAPIKMEDIAGIIQTTEPWFDQLVFRIELSKETKYKDVIQTTIDDYIASERDKTDYNLSERVIIWNGIDPLEEGYNTITTRLDTLNPDYFWNALPNVPQIIYDCGKAGVTGTFSAKHSEVNYSISINNIQDQSQFDHVVMKLDLPELVSI